MSMEVEVQDHSAELLAGMESQIPAALTAVGGQAAFYCAEELENSPRRVDTGRLKNSINFIVQEREVHIGTNVEYGIYVHEGTSRMSPNRFLTNGLELHADEYREIIREYLSQ